MDKEQCRKLIQLYGSYRGLWDSQDPEYARKNVREDAWKHISQEMNLPVAELRKKIESLLGSFRREKSREKKSRLSGRVNVYKSNWYAYEYFYFMANKNNPANSEEIIEEDNKELIRRIPEAQNATGSESGERETPHERHETETADQGTERQAQVRRKRKKKNVADTQEKEPHYNGVSRTFDCAGSYGYSYSTYGQYIANELRKYDPFTLAHVKNAINNIIFEADTGKYQQYDRTYYAEPLSAAGSGYSSATSNNSYTPIPASPPNVAL